MIYPDKKFYIMPLLKHSDSNRTNDFSSLLTLGVVMGFLENMIKS